MNNVIPMRERDLRGRFLPKVDPLWNEVVGNILAKDLAEKLSEPLDDPQFDGEGADWKQAQREVW